MKSCLICGGPVGDFDVGGDLICQNCEARGLGYASDNLVACQRCGTKVMKYEIRSQSGKLCCTRCAFELQDEERRGRGYGSEGSRLAGICERCGREVEFLYSVHGKRLCFRCKSGAGGPPPESPSSPSFLGMVVDLIISSLGVRKPRPKIISIIPKEKIIKKEIKQERGGESEGKVQIFDLKERKMVEKDENYAPAEPPPKDSNGGADTEDKKEDGAKPKDAFFFMHSGKSNKKTDKTEHP